jgi:hypothetical protein
LGSTELNVWNDEGWEVLDTENISELIRPDYSDGVTTLQAVPEPVTILLVITGHVAVLLVRFFCKD